MIRIAIVDDNPNDRAAIASCLDFVAVRENVQFGITEFSSGMEFILNYTPVYDIVLMDVEMPETDGIETARMLREADKSVLLIFVTNLAQYAIKGYEVDALDFLIKPVNNYTMAMKMHRAISRTAKRVDDAVQIKTGGGRIRTSGGLDQVYRSARTLRRLSYHGGRIQRIHHAEKRRGQDRDELLCPL